MDLAHPALRNLHLILAEAREIDLLRYRVFATREVPLAGGRLLLHVIGASSLVQVERDAVGLVEIIACAPAEAVPACLGRADVPQDGTPVRMMARASGCAYAARLWTTCAGEGAATDCLEHVLEHRFPGPGSPLTRIEAGAAGGLLQVRTRHDYPEAGVTLWSDSKWVFS